MTFDEKCIEIIRYIAQGYTISFISDISAIPGEKRAHIPIYDKNKNIIKTFDFPDDEADKAYLFYRKNFIDKQKSS